MVYFDCSYVRRAQSVNGRLGNEILLYCSVQNSLEKCRSSPDTLACQKICVKSLELFLNIPCSIFAFEALLLVSLLPDVLELSQFLPSLKEKQSAQWMRISPCI